MKKFIQIVAVIAITASMALADKPTTPNPHKKNKHGETRQSGSKNGAYSITITGAYLGRGVATVDEEGISFQIDVVGATGAAGKFIATKLTIEGPYFTGTGSAIGHVVAISGRLDAAKASRLSGTYVAANGESGRVTGTLPDDPGDPEWEEKIKDKDKDKDKDKKDKD